MTRSTTATYKKDNIVAQLPELWTTRSLEIQKAENVHLRFTICPQRKCANCANSANVKAFTEMYHDSTVDSFRSQEKQGGNMKQIETTEMESDLKDTHQV